MDSILKKRIVPGYCDRSHNGVSDYGAGCRYR